MGEDAPDGRRYGLHSRHGLCVLDDGEWTPITLDDVLHWSAPTLRWLADLLERAPRAYVDGVPEFVAVIDVEVLQLVELLGLEEDEKGQVH